jgi:hypothetical protein
VNSEQPQPLFRGGFRRISYFGIVRAAQSKEKAMAVSVSSLRQNIYRLLDQVLDTGIPLEIERRNRKLRIVPAERPGKLKNLKKHCVLNCKPEEIVHVDWSKALRN